MFRLVSFLSRQVGFTRWKGLQVRTLVLKLFTIAALTAASSAVASAQGPAAADPAEPQQAPAAPAPSRQALIEQEQADKETNSKPYVANKGERLFQRLDAVIAGGSLKWHPFFDSAYSGGGFTLGVGRSNYVSAYNSIDVRGSYTDHRLQACRSGVHRAAHVQPARDICRSSPGGARRPRSAFTASGRTARRTIAPTTCSNSPTPRRS